MTAKTEMQSKNYRPVDLDDVTVRIFHIANVLDVLYRALPSDGQGEIPVRSLTNSLAEQAEAIANELSELVCQQRLSARGLQLKSEANHG